MKYIAEIDGLEFPIEILDEHHVKFGDQVLDVDFSEIGESPLYSLIVNGRSFEAYVYPDEKGWQILFMGHSFPVVVEDEREKRLRTHSQDMAIQTGESALKAPMPGLVIAVHVEEGQSVEKGQTLIVLESMKMQNELKAPCTGKISRLRIKTGDSVEQKQLLLMIG